MKVEMLGISLLLILGIYLASLVQNIGYAVAAQHMSWILGAGILSVSLGMMVKAVLA